MSTWHHVDTAAALAGVHRDSVHDWLNTGARLRDRLESGALRRSDLSAEERRRVDFSDAVVESIAKAEGRGLDTIARGALLESVETRTVDKCIGVDETGQPIYATTTTTIRKPPTVAPMQWIMERRFPERWGPKVQGMGEGGALPIDVRIRSVLEAVERHKGGQRGLPLPEEGE